MADYERIRLVILGGAGVGKSCIIRRFLSNTYNDKYRSTIEDLYNREFEIGRTTLKVDILDTAGDMQFPAMRRLCIANAHAFLMVYAVTSAPSFHCVKSCFEEIKEQRDDFQEIPMVIAGNKFDLAASHREVRIEDVSEWVYCQLPKLRIKVLECSAKDDINVREIFRSFLNLSRLLLNHPKNSSDDTSSSFKRRSSAYVSHSHSNNKTEEKGRESTNLQETVTLQNPKPRSRSLIRRSSRKTKQQIRDANNEDCNVS